MNKTTHLVEKWAKYSLFNGFVCSFSDHLVCWAFWSTSIIEAYASRSKNGLQYLSSSTPYALYVPKSIKISKKYSIFELILFPINVFIFYHLNDVYQTFGIEKSTDVTINAYIGLFLWSTHFHYMLLHAPRRHVEIIFFNFPQYLWKYDKEYLYQTLKFLEDQSNQRTFCNLIVVISGMLNMCID